MEQLSRTVSTMLTYGKDASRGLSATSCHNICAMGETSQVHEDTCCSISYRQILAARKPANDRSRNHAANPVFRYAYNGEDLAMFYSLPTQHVYSPALSPFGVEKSCLRSSKDVVRTKVMRHVVIHGIHISNLHESLYLVLFCPTPPGSTSMFNVFPAA